MKACSLRHCRKQLGSWSIVGSCIATRPDKSCGPGNQRQTRSCVDGTIDRCSSSDRYRSITCNRPDCPIEIGPWRNSGQCRPTGSHGKQCGDGNQSQTRSCVDGTRVKCHTIQRQRTITCKSAGTPLRKCTGQYH